jgi:hypothetical protein
MAESILRLTVNSSEYDNKLKRATEQLTRYADGCRKVGGTLQYVDDNVVEFARSLGRMETTATTARGKVAELTKSYTELAVQYKNMTDEEKKGEYGKALAASLDQLRGRVQESKVQLDDINKSINGGGGLTGALDAVAGKFGLSIDQVTKFGGVVGVATTAVQVAKDAFFQSESNIDEWGRTVEGAKGAYSVFLDTLNNGNWSNFFQNLSAAIRGGRDLYDVFDRLGSIKSNNAAAIAITQKEIAELRLAKQQGENVDAKLKSATERLAALQKQGVSAGMAAGSTSAFQTIRNGVNSIGGAGVNDATIQYAVNRIMKGGQAEFDRYKRNYDVLRQRGTGMTTSYQTTAYGGTMAVQKREFNLANLTQEEQKQYALAKAITEGETRIQQGIAAYAQAVSEGTSAAREEFKGNRYALQGAGGGGGGNKGGKGGSGFDISSIAFDANKAMLSGVKAEDAMPSVAEMVKPENIFGQTDEWEKYKDTITGSIGSIGESMSNLTQWTSDFDPYRENMEKMTKAAKQQRMAFGMAGQAAENFGAALAGMDDPAARAAGTVISAIANIALGFGMAVAQASSMGPWAWLAYVAAGTAALATTISTVHQLTGYAEGGMIKGNSYSGDNIGGMVDGGAGGFVGLNAGEIVLNKAQQSTLAGQLQGNGLQNMNISGRTKGTDIILSVDRSLQLQGKQLLTWG